MKSSTLELPQIKHFFNDVGVGSPALDQCGMGLITVNPFPTFAFSERSKNALAHHSVVSLPSLEALTLPSGVVDILKGLEDPSRSGAGAPETRGWFSEVPAPF